MNRALQVGCCALVSDTLSLESQYISYLLSIDCLRHPLFAGCGPHLLPRDPVSADYQFSAEEFADLRLPLIGGNVSISSPAVFTDKAISDIPKH